MTTMHGIVMNVVHRQRDPGEMFIYSSNLLVVLAIRPFRGCFSGLVFQR